jgi:hypothetical protein
MADPTVPADRTRRPMEVPMAPPASWSQQIHTRLLRLLAYGHRAALRLHQRQQGLSATEYLLVAAVVVGVVFVAVKLFFGAVADKFSELTRTVSGG